MNDDQKKELEILKNRLKFLTRKPSISFSKLIKSGKEYNGLIYDDNQKDEDGNSPLIYEYKITPKGGSIISYYDDIYKDKIAEDIQIKNYITSDSVLIKSEKENINLIIIVTTAINRNKGLAKLIFYLGENIPYALNILIVWILLLGYIAIKQLINFISTL